VILVPEHPFRLTRVCELLRRRERQGSAFSIIVVAEDAHPHPDEDFLDEAAKQEIYATGRLGGIGFHLAREIERQTGIETRHANLGYVQRGGSPSAFDRVLATRFGVKAFEMVLEKRGATWPRSAATRSSASRSTTPSARSNASTTRSTPSPKSSSVSVKVTSDREVTRKKSRSFLSPLITLFTRSLSLLSRHFSSYLLLNLRLYLLALDVEAQAVVEAHVLVGDPDEREEREEVAAPVFVEKL
jgi:6-phosphofructokinase